MTIEWSTSGPELLLALDRHAATPLRAQLEGQLRDAVRSGRLAAGERLPSSRVLAGQLGLADSLPITSLLARDCEAQGLPVIRPLPTPPSNRRSSAPPLRRAS